MRDLAARLQCDPSNVTFLADRLEERGLVERRPDPSGRRVKLLALTPAGLAMRIRVVKARPPPAHPGPSVARGPTAPLPAVRQVLTYGTAGVASSDQERA